VGQVPAKLEEEFGNHMSAQGLDEAIRYSQYGDLGTDVLGVVLRAQRVGGTIPMEEWHVYF